MKYLIVLIGLLAFNASARHRLPSLEAEYVGNISEMTEQGMKISGSAQGFAVYGKYGFQFRNKGQCNIIDLDKKKVVRTFKLKGNTSHCNNANFGLHKYNKDSDMPLLYISECLGRKSCYVTDLHLDGRSEIVQRIFYDDDAETDYEYMDWTLDNENGFIYTFGGCTGGPKIMRKFKMPSLADSDEKGEVHFKKSDILETIVMNDFYVSQGSRIHKGYCYLPEGYVPFDRKLHVLDLKEKKIVKTLNLNAFAKEPEGLDIRGRWLYVSFHQTRTARGTSYVRFRL